MHDRCPLSGSAVIRFKEVTMGYFEVNQGYLVFFPVELGLWYGFREVTNLAAIQAAKETYRVLSSAIQIRAIIEDFFGGAARLTHHHSLLEACAGNVTWEQCTHPTVISLEDGRIQCLQCMVRKPLRGRAV